MARDDFLKIGDGSVHLTDVFLPLATGGALPKNTARLAHHVHVPAQRWTALRNGARFVALQIAQRGAETRLGRRQITATLRRVDVACRRSREGREKCGDDEERAHAELPCVLDNCSNGLCSRCASARRSATTRRGDFHAHAAIGKSADRDATAHARRRAHGATRGRTRLRGLLTRARCSARACYRACAAGGTRHRDAIVISVRVCQLFAIGALRLRGRNR